MAPKIRQQQLRTHAYKPEKKTKQKTVKEEKYENTLCRSARKSEDEWSETSIYYYYDMTKDRCVSFFSMAWHSALQNQHQRNEWAMRIKFSNFYTINSVCFSGTLIFLSRRGYGAQFLHCCCRWCVVHAIISADVCQILQRCHGKAQTDQCRGNRRWRRSEWCFRTLSNVCDERIININYLL